MDNFATYLKCSKHDCFKSYEDSTFECPQCLYESGILREIRVELEEEGK